MRIRILSGLLLISLYSCGQNSTKHTVNPLAVKLNDEAMTLVDHLDNIDSCKKGLYLMDKATSVDSNYFLGYWNKCMFQYKLKQYDKLILTYKQILRITPNAHDVYLACGLIYEKIGDSISAKNFFKKSLAICSPVLDTMSRKNRLYSMLVMNKGCNLILLGEQSKGTEVFQKFIDEQPNDPQFDNIFSNEIKSSIGLDKNQLLDRILNPHKQSY